METLIPFLLFLFLLSWLGLTVYNLTAINRLKDRMSRLEGAMARLHREPAKAPPPRPAVPPPVETPAAAPADLQRQEPRRVQTFEERLNYLEGLVGTRWLNWVGALVILAGTAFLLKFLYDRGWIGPAGRVSIGLGIGAALLFLGEVKLRKFHDLFSQSLSATGCGALFLTSYLSFKFYDFGSRTSTFALLCWFALFAMALAVARRGPVLAFLGLLCAYLTPYLLSIGQDQAEMLFAYLAILLLAVAAMNLIRNWRGIVSVGIAFTWLYYIGWFSEFYKQERLVVASIGAAAFILLISAAALFRGLWKMTGVRLEECTAIAVSTVLGLYFLWHCMAERELALGTTLCGLALFFLIALQVARTRKAWTPLLESTLLCLASGSVLLLIPVSLEASGAMVAWAFAAILFAELGTRSARLPLICASAFSLAAGLLVGFSHDVFHTGAFVPVANGVFVGWLAVAGSWLFVGYRLFRSYPERSFLHSSGSALQVLSSFMLVGLFTYEVTEWFAGQTRLPGTDDALYLDYRNVILSVVWAACPWLWLLGSKAHPRSRELASVQYGIIGLAFLSMLSGFHHRETVVFLNPVFLSSLLFPAGIFLLAARVGEERRKLKYALQTYAHTLCVILLAVELSQGLYLEAWPASSREWIRMALVSVAWAVYATVLLGVGISRSIQPWRWFALGLLGLTLFKVVFLDMAEVRQIWRVLSFMVLGAVLMICSYVYNRHERMRRDSANPSGVPDEPGAIQDPSRQSRSPLS